MYEQVALVNKAFVQRLTSIKTQDANLNALVNLDCFALFASVSIGADGLAELEDLFSAYFE